MEANEKRFPCVEVRQCSLGRGVFAVAPVPKGKLLLKIEGERLNFEEQYQTEHEANAVQIGEDLYINPEAPGLYLNHSCDPNCYIDSELWLVAARHIKAGEQLLFDYSTSMLERDWQMKDCQCGSALCRGTISDFDELPVEVQDRYLRQGGVMDHVVRHPALKLSLTIEDGQIGTLPAMRHHHPTTRAMTPPLSPAALRAAMDLVVPEPDDVAKETFSIAALRHRWQIRDLFLSIAAELEAP